MMFPQVSSELERMWLVGRAVWQTTLGFRGWETSTAVKFFGALSWASHMMRRPSGAICTDMPSPMPPKPPSRLCESSLKFWVMVPSAAASRRIAGFLTADFFTAGLAVFALKAFFAVFALAFGAAVLATFFFFAATAGFFLLDPEIAFFTERKMLFALFIICSVG